MSPSAEQDRLAADGRSWKRWGPYVSERAWGTVREDYSEGGDAWDYLPHDHARSRAYRWNEDGLAGLCDDRQLLCFALAFWNGQDPILKERIFGLTGSEGNHGEDAKELWWYLDSTPTHSWMRWSYVYPQAAFPYEQLVAENRSRDRHAPEIELLDTGVLDDDRYWDITADYAKAGPDDICVRITVRNAGPDEASLHVLPTLSFRNTWSWGLDDRKPVIVDKHGALVAEHHALGRRRDDDGRVAAAPLLRTSRTPGASGARMVRHSRRTASASTSSTEPRRSTRDVRAPRRRSGIDSRSRPAKCGRSASASRARGLGSRGTGSRRWPSGSGRPTSSTRP